MRILSAAICSMVFAISVQAQAPYLVKDINTSYTPSAQSSLPRSFTASGAFVYFAASTAATGMELFKTDGATVQLVKDIYPGLNGSSPISLMDLGNGSIVFSASDAVNGRELWISDGSAAGTLLLKDIYPGISSSSPSLLLAVGGKAFFLANGGLWVTDGTETGTKSLVASMSVGAVRFTSLGGVFYFANGTSLWRSDGSVAGTYPVKSDIAPGFMTVANGKLFLAAWDQAHGYELWTSDGTEAGTAIVKDINPGAAGSFNSALGVIGSAVVFFAYDGTHALSLWRSDGTEAGTLLYRELATYSGVNTPPVLQSAAGAAFFALGGSLWRTDGTDAGTFSLAAVSQPYGFATSPSKLYFVARDETSGFRLWQSDGTDLGTSKIAPAVTVYETAPELRYTGGKLYFAGTTGLTGAEPWTSDGTAAGTAILANLMDDPPASANPTELRGVGSRLFFTATDGTPPSQVWTSDASGAGTTALTAFPDTGYSTTGLLTAWNGSLFFIHGNELWQSDGTAAGTTLFKQMSVQTMLAGANYLYLAGYEGSPYYTYRLWRTDGTTGGTIQLTDGYSSPALIGEIAGRLYFLMGGSLWRTDGTLVTTEKVFDLGYPLNGETPVVMGGALYYGYGASYSYTNAELWRTDGTPEGAAMVKDIRPGGGGSAPHSLTAAGTLVYFIANDGTHGDEVWRTDGTEAGTFLLKDILPGSGSSTPSSLVAVNGTLYFVANDGIDGAELWKSDGTPAGTILVADLAPGSASSDPQQLAAADGKVWFSASTTAAGAELWTSDGTPGGTAMVADLEPGSGSSSPREITAAARHLFFSANTAAGRELWAMPLATSGFSIADARIVEADAGSTLMHFTVTRSGDLSQAATVAYATADGTAAAGSDYTATNGTLSFAANAASASFDVTVTADNAIERDEVFFVSLSAPSLGVIDRATAFGVIEDDDKVVDLSVGILQRSSASSSYYSDPGVVITNLGPSTATKVQLVFTQSPREFTNYTANANCTNAAHGRVTCTVDTILPGESRTIGFSTYSSYGGELYSDPANPPGFTTTAVVSAREADSDPSNNSMSRMLSFNRTLMTPPYLVSGTNTTGELLLPYALNSTATYNVTSTNPLVVGSPVTLSAGQSGSTFTLQVGNGTGATILNVSPSNDPMTIPIVLSGQTPNLDPIIDGPASYNNYYKYGDDIEIPVRMVGIMPDGTRPTGVVELLDDADAVLAQAPLDADSSAKFVRTGLQPGSYHYKVRYSGDAHFNALTVSYPTYTVRSWSTYTAVLVPRVLCGNVLDVVATVYTTDVTQAPPGQVTFTFGQQVITVDLVPAKEPGKSRATVQFPLGPSSSYYVSAQYQATGTFSPSSGYGYPPTPGCTALGLNATATAANRVSLSWNPTGASSYEIYRSSSFSSSFAFLGYSTTNAYIDAQVQANQFYVYRVRPVGGLLSEPDLASTAFFTNDPIVAGVTLIKASHFTELWGITTLARSAIGASSSQATTTPPAIGAAVTPVHITDLRAAIDEVRRYFGVLPVTYTDPSLTAGTPIKAVHLQQLRDALK